VDRKRPFSLLLSWSAFASSLATCLLVSTGHAEPAADLQAARDLFLSAEKEEDAGHWSDALEKLQRVAHVRQTAGVRYHIALCEEHLGQIASALADYTAAETQARSENAQDVLRLVGKARTAVSLRAPRVTIHVTPDLPDVQVTLDGVPLPRERVGVAVPVDPGEHRIEATAPKHTPAHAAVTVREEEAVVLDLELVQSTARSDTANGAPAPSVPNAYGPGETTAAPVAATARRSAHAGAIASTATAIVLAGAGVTAFLIAGSDHSSAVSECAQVPSRSADACDSQKNWVRAWDFAAAGAWLGAATMGAVAVVLWSKGESVGLRLGPASIGVGGRF
jgi:hypothetical protein